jgi:hypothetical protein
MANTHVLDKQAGGIRVVLHIAVPSSNNAVGTNWQTAVVNSGLFGRPPGSVMPTGTGPGQITSAELASVAAGSLIEVVDLYTPNPQELAAGTAYLQGMYTQRSAYWLAFYQEVLRYFGFTST